MKRVALITGGTRGIGFGVATALGKEGFDLCVCGLRTAEAAGESLAALRATGAEVLYFRADIGSKADRAALLQAIEKHYGRLHVLVNNAGVAPEVRADILEAGEESFERLMRINLQGPYFLTQAAANWMVEQMKTTPGYEGCIVNISSIAGLSPSGSSIPYAVSKAGLIHLTRCLAVALAPSITVNCVVPGLMEGTRMFARVPPDRVAASRQEGGTGCGVI